MSCLVLNKISAEQLGDSKRLSFSWFDTTSDMDYIRVPTHRDPKIMGPNLFCVAVLALTKLHLGGIWPLACENGNLMKIYC